MNITIIQPWIIFSCFVIGYDYADNDEDLPKKVSPGKHAVMVSLAKPYPLSYYWVTNSDEENKNLFEGFAQK